MGAGSGRGPNGRQPRAGRPHHRRFPYAASVAERPGLWRHCHGHRPHLFLPRRAGRPPPRRADRDGPRAQSGCGAQPRQYRGGPRAIPHPARRPLAADRRQRRLEPRGRRRHAGQRRRHQGRQLPCRGFCRQLGDRPVRPPALAHRRAKGTLPRQRGSRARHPADAGGRHRRCLADLCRRRQPAHHRAKHLSGRGLQRCPHHPAGGGRRGPPLRPAAGRAGAEQPATSTPCACSPAPRYRPPPCPPTSPMPARTSPPCRPAWIPPCCCAAPMWPKPS